MPRDTGRTLVAQIPEELHKEVRIAATREGKTMRRFVIEALEEKLKGPRDSVEDDIERQRREAMERIRARFAHVPQDVSLVDELFARRREEAERESADVERERQEALEELWEIFSAIPPGVSLADELIAERRAEARREAAE
jgi:hypothetical protein